MLVFSYSESHIAKTQHGHQCANEYAYGPLGAALYFCTVLRMATSCATSGGKLVMTVSQTIEKSSAK